MRGVPTAPRRSRPLPCCRGHGVGDGGCAAGGWIFSQDDGQGAIMQNPEPSVILLLSFLRMIHNV